MKTKILLFIVAVFVSYGTWAQDPTSFGGFRDTNPANNAGDVGNHSSFFGDQAGVANMGAWNTFIGALSGLDNMAGVANTFLGYQSGMNNTNGIENTFLGTNSGLTNTGGDNNTFIGYASGDSNTNGNNNTFVGYASGANNMTGSGNVFLGITSGGTAVNTSNELFIDNSNTNNPLIWGDFSANRLNFNGDVGIGTENPSATLHVIGNARITDIPRDVGDNLTHVLVEDAQGDIHWRTATSLDDQNLSVISAGTNRTINISGGSGTNFSVADNDNNSANEFNSTFALNGTSIEIADLGGTLSLDLDGTFATDAELAAHVDADADPNNEFNTAFTLNGTSIEITDLGSTLSLDLDGTFATDAELTLSYDANPHILSIAGGNSVNIAPFASYPASAGDGGGNTNSYFGHEAGANSTGINNTFVGHRSGFNNTGNDNSSLGSQTLENNTTGIRNTANGVFTLFGNTTGDENTAVGYAALGFNSTGNRNTATGSQALLNNQGDNNTANGHQALTNNTTGSENTANGYEALRNNTEGHSNTATGTRALLENIDGDNNTANGYEALTNNTIGLNNTAMGMETLLNNTDGDDNTAIGYQALLNNITGNSNTAIGMEALLNNTTGSNNTAIGRDALLNNTNGSNNAAIGQDALLNNTTGIDNIAIGHDALTYNGTGSENVAVGFNSGPTFGNPNLSNTIAIGSNVGITASNQVRIGNYETDPDGLGVPVHWTIVSDGRFKINVEEDVAGLDFINSLRPVSYNLDRRKIRAFTGNTNATNGDISKKIVGFVAQEVEQSVQEGDYVFTGVKVPVNEKDHYGLKYAEFVVPLVKGMQEQQQMIATLQQQNETLEQRIEALESLIGSTNETSPLQDDSTQSKNTGINDEGFVLYQNTPNPFDKTTVISALVPRHVQQAKIAIYNLNGLELESYPVTGRGSVTLEISEGRFPSGIYIYALIADGSIIDTKKMILKK